MSNHRFIVVDRRNLFFWLSRGLIVPRPLISKYRPDALEHAGSRLPVASEDAIGALVADAEYAVAVELAPEVDVLTEDKATEPVLLLRGALSAQRIQRLHVASAPHADEIRARVYRGFDPSELEIAVTPSFFSSSPQWTAPTATDDAEQLNDLALKQRESVAGAVFSMLAGGPDSLSFPLDWMSAEFSSDPIEQLVAAVRSTGIVTREDDLDLLHKTLVAIFVLSEQGDIVPSRLLEEIFRSLDEPDTAGIRRHLERILQLVQGLDELRPFKSPGGLLTTKALLLYLLRPDPEAVRGWTTEEVNAEPAVLQLSRLLAGFASRYSGLPAMLRKSDVTDRVLDWTALGLQPNEFEIRPSSRDPESSEAASAPRPPVDDPVLHLRNEISAGKNDRAIALAKSLGWVDCLQLRVVAHAFETTAVDTKVQVTFSPDAELDWTLDVQRFLTHLSNAAAVEVSAAFRPRS